MPENSQVLSVMPPGSTYGLSHFLKGEREHLRQVICESSSGLVYTLFAKDVAAHLSQQERLQVVATVPRFNCAVSGAVQHSSARSY